MRIEGYRSHDLERAQQQQHAQATAKLREYQTPPPGVICGGDYDPVAPTPRIPDLVDIHCALGNLGGQFAEILDRMTASLDRASGPEPQPEHGQQGEPAPCSLVGQIHLRLQHLDHIARALLNETARLERIA